MLNDKYFFLFFRCDTQLFFSFFTVLLICSLRVFIFLQCVYQCANRAPLYFLGGWKLSCPSWRVDFSSCLSELFYESALLFCKEIKTSVWIRLDSVCLFVCVFSLGGCLHLCVITSVRQQRVSTCVGRRSLVCNRQTNSSWWESADLQSFLFTVFVNFYMLNVHQMLPSFIYLII